MNRSFLRRTANAAAAILVVMMVSALAAAPASATTFTGTVKNGTTGKAAAGVDVVLLSLQGSMEAVANTKTDAQGHYQLNYTPAGQMPLLVRAIYKGMNFHAMLPPGTVTADVQIYDPNSDAHSVQFPTRLIVFQPNGSTLLVGEEYEVQNQTTPPVAYFNANGNFEFQLPDGADNMQVSAQGPERMPVVEATIDRGKNHYAVAYAFRPGESAVRLSYEIPYGSNKASLHVPTTYAADKVLLMAPPTVSLSASGFQPAGTEQGMTVYERDGIPAGTAIDVSLSGTAPPPTDDQQSQPDGAPPTGRDADASVTAVPPRLDTLKWILVGGFAALFFLGAAFLLRKPLPVAVPAGSVPAVPAPRTSTKEIAAPPVTAPVSAAQALGAVDRDVTTSLDQLKDTLFKLELRHQAGTISDQEYAEQRARTEKILRDLVRG